MKIKVRTFEEKLPNGRKYLASYRKDYSFQNSDKFLVPDNHFFLLAIDLSTMEIVYPW